MKKQYLFGIIGLAIVFAFAIVGFMGVPAIAETQELTGDVPSLSDDSASSSTCTLADSGSCPNAATCGGSCGANTAGGSCSGSGSCSGEGSCGGSCGGSQAASNGAAPSCHG